MTAKQLAGKQQALRRALVEAAGRVGRHLANDQARASAAAYLEALLGGATRKNGWQLAEAAGLSTPYRFQHLLGRAVWEADAVRDDHLQEVLRSLGQRDAVLAIDETGFVKQGKKSVGVARQYCGASGKIDNCQVGVFLSWQTARGHALIERALYLPRDWAQDKERRRAAGVPGSVAFAPKPELARARVERARSAGARPAWVGAGAAYGSDSKLRFWREEREQPHVLATTSAQSVCVGFAQYRVKALARQAPADAWVRLSVGAGAKGPRRFDWAALPVNHPYDARRWGRWVLLRRSIARPAEITCYLAFGRGGHPGRRAGACSGAALGHRGGLCAGQGGSGPGPLRGALLGRVAPARHPGHGRPGALGHHPGAALRRAGGRPVAGGRGKKCRRHRRRGAADAGRLPSGPRAGPRRPRLVRVSVAEVRRFFRGLLRGAARTVADLLHWSNWRRKHQAAAKFFHYQARGELALLQL